MLPLCANLRIFLLESMQKLISPSLLSADFLNLGDACDMLNRSEAQWYHLDIMDGLFVPNISYGMPLIRAFRSATDKVLDVHLMIENPDQYLAEFADCGADILTVHAESVVHLHRTVGHIKSLGCKAGVALCPSTPLSAVEEVLGDVDMVLLMSVNPGFGGQSFIHSSIDKVKRLRKMISERGFNTLIQIDGGVTLENAGELYGAGCDCLVAGSAVFCAQNPEQMISDILASGSPK